MWTYETTVKWSGGKKGRALCAGKPDIEISTPPEFGGPEGCWTPEDLLAASVAGCLMTSALFFIERDSIALSSCECRARAVMQKTPQGLAITGISVDVNISLQDPGQEPALRRALERAEASCPVSKSLNCPVELALQLGR